MAEQTSAEMRVFIGQRVTLVISRDPMRAFTGLFLSCDDYGEAVLRTDDGVTRYLWPALAVEPSDG